MLDLAIKGGTLVTEWGTYPADIGVEGTAIAAVGRPGTLPAARHELDAAGLLVLPGAIDIHFHVRAPGYPERGTFVTETGAAAAGGVTTVLEMPISTPGCARRDIFESRRALGQAQAIVNFGLYGAPGLLQRDEILGMAEAGACGFKIFTHAAPPDRADEFLGICLPDEDDLYRALELVSETGLLTTVHAENERLIQLFDGRMRGTGRTDPAAFTASRPTVVEAMSVAQLAVISEALGARIHVAHVSAEWPLRILREAQARGLPMTGETCPHYLAFTSDDLERHGPFALIKPPLRTAADQTALWQGLADGTLTAITTDHSPFTLAEKERGSADIWRAAIGAPGVEALVPFTLTEALEGRITLEQAVRLICGQPARLFGLQDRKGQLAPGMDADILLYDPRSAGPIDSSRWVTQARAIERLYHGRASRGHVHATVVNGTVVFRDGAVVGKPGTGQFVQPTPGGQRIPHRA